MSIRYAILMGAAVLMSGINAFAMENVVPPGMQVVTPPGMKVVAPPNRPTAPPQSMGTEGASITEREFVAILQRGVSLLQKNASVRLLVPLLKPSMPLRTWIKVGPSAGLRSLAWGPPIMGRHGKI